MHNLTMSDLEDILKDCLHSETVRDIATEGHDSVNMQPAVGAVLTALQKSNNTNAEFCNSDIIEACRRIRAKLDIQAIVELTISFTDGVDEVTVKTNRYEYYKAIKAEGNFLMIGPWYINKSRIAKIYMEHL